MSASKSSLYQVLTLESNNKKRTVDLKLGTVSIDYYEDIFSPTITAKLVVVNTGDSIEGEKSNKMESIYHGLPLRGGERLSMKILDQGSDSEGENKKGIDFSTSPDDYLYVSSITNVMSDSTKEIFTLNLVSREAIANETTRVETKYTYAIHDSVKKILKDVLKTEKIGEIENAENKYAFIGNMRKPFTVLVWLSPKAVPEAGSGAKAGFVFYQTQDGFNFRSIDGLMSQKSKATYTYSQVVENDKESNNDYRILKYRTDKNQNLIEKLRLGAYASQRMFFNPLDFSFTKPEDGKFQMATYKDRIKNLGSDEISLPTMGEGSDVSLGDVPTRILCSVVDVGTMVKGVGEDSIKVNADPSDYQAQSIMRYNMLFTQSISMTVPCNTNLRAGDIIECQFPKISSEESRFDTEQSGLYMIKELCHHFEPHNSYTSMTLVRDNFGVNKNG